MRDKYALFLISVRGTLYLQHINHSVATVLVQEKKKNTRELLATDNTTVL